MTINFHQPLLAALQNPQVFPHSTGKFEVLETHISWVLLTGEYAYKIKKPVDLGFVDFSTLEKRRHFCHEEMRLNSRLAPELYLEVVAISGNERAPEINSDGDIFEYAVKMRQFQQKNLLLTLLDTEHLSRVEIDQLAMIIADFHRVIAVAGLDSEYGTTGAVLAPVSENFKQIRQYVDTSLEQQLQAIEGWSLQEHQRHFQDFIERKRTGFIRECHGDLHLGNIVLYRDKVMPFDGIEFNPNLYWIDVISELAFVMMDLEDHGRSDLAYRLLNGYLEQTGDYSGLKVLRYYLVYRAMVRAKVNSIRLNQTINSEDLSVCRSNLCNYLNLASYYTQTTDPALIICHGLAGSGKTTVSQLLLEQLPAIRIRSDVERKRLHNLKPDQKSNSGISSGIYTKTSTRQTYQLLLERASTLLKSGYTTIVDATFLHRQQRHYFQAYAESNNITFIIVSCVVDVNTLRQRVAARQQSATEASEADTTVLEHQIHGQQPLTEDEQKYCVQINSESPIDIMPVLKRVRCNKRER